jgi:hypothetical protein
VNRSCNRRRVYDCGALVRTHRNPAAKFSTVTCKLTHRYQITYNCDCFIVVIAVPPHCSALPFAEGFAEVTKFSTAFRLQGARTNHFRAWTCFTALTTYKLPCPSMDEHICDSIKPQQKVYSDYALLLENVAISCAELTSECYTNILDAKHSIDGARIRVFSSHTC